MVSFHTVGELVRLAEEKDVPIHEIVIAHEMHDAQRTRQALLDEPTIPLDAKMWIAAAIWAVADVGLVFWPLFSRLFMFAVIGLVVNLVSARLLHGGQGHHHHGHDHRHDHHHADHDHGRHGHDNNLRAAYLHVLADALTSVLAIAALLVGRSYGWLWAEIGRASCRERVSSPV